MLRAHWGGRRQKKVLRKIAKPEVKVKVAGIEDREELFQLLNRMEKILWKIW